MMHGLSKRLRAFGSDRGGNVVILSALALPVMVGMVALSVEYGSGLMKRVENQRIADLAAFAGATAYNAKATEAAMLAAAQNVGLLNGVDASDLKVELINSPRTADTKAVKVDVTTQQNLYLARVIGDFDQLTVAAAATAELPVEPAAGCILAFSGSGTGVTMIGGTSMRADDCVISSNATVTVPCGTSIITDKGVTYNSTAAPSQPCGGIKSRNGPTTSITKARTPDPLAGNTAVADAVARLGQVAAISTASAQSIPNMAPIDFGYNPVETKARAADAGCSATSVDGKWRVTCPASGTSRTTFNFGAVTMGGGITVEIDGPSNATYNFSGPIVVNGTSLTISAGTFNIKGGISVGGGASLTLGSGTSNSYRIWPASNGRAIDHGGASLTMADAIGPSSVFQIFGDVLSGGGGCFTLPAARQHDIKGSIRPNGGLILGAGTYTISDHFAAASGGRVTCNGVSVAVAGTDVSLVIGGSKPATEYVCGNSVFCLAGGFSGVRLSAPKSGAMAKLLFIGPQNTSNTYGATFAGGGSAVMSGVFYFPNGPIKMDGGAEATGDVASTTDCLQFIGSQITLSGGVTTASNCISASSAAKAVSLVQ